MYNPNVNHDDDEIKQAPFGLIQNFPFSLHQSFHFQLGSHAKRHVGAHDRHLHNKTTVSVPIKSHIMWWQ